MKRGVALILFFLFLLSAAAYALPAESAFLDVPENYWAFEAIQEMADRGIVIGVGDGYFDPAGAVTRGQFALMLQRAFGRDAGLDQSDKTLASRYDMARALYTVFPAQPDYTELMAVLWTVPDFMDGRVPLEYAIPVASVYAQGLLTGKDQYGTFDGTGNMTRAQACVVLQRLQKKLADSAYSVFDEVEGYDPRLVTYDPVSATVENKNAAPYQSTVEAPLARAGSRAFYDSYMAAFDEARKNASQLDILDTAYCTVISGAYWGTSHGSHAFVRLIYSDGRLVEVPVPPRSNWGMGAEPTEIWIGEDGATLLRRYHYDEAVFAGGLSMKSGDYLFMTDLRSGITLYAPEN